MGWEFTLFDAVVNRRFAQSDSLHHFREHLALQEKKAMNEKLILRLDNPLMMFFWSAAMLLAGIVVGEHWHPKHALTAAIALAAGAFTWLHELVCCFVWCSLSSWWIGRRMNEVKGRR